MSIPARFILPILAVLPWLSPAMASGADKARSLTWDKQVIQLQLEPSATSAEAWFTFVNETGTAIHIIDTQSDCDCLVPSMDRSVYYPGEAGLLFAQVEVKLDEDVITKRVLVNSRAGNEDPRTTELLVIARRSQP